MAWLVVTPPVELRSRLFDGDTTCFPAAAGLDSCKSRLILAAAIVVGSGDGSSPLLSTYRTDTWLPCTSGTRLHLKKKKIFQKLKSKTTVQRAEDHGP